MTYKEKIEKILIPAWRSKKMSNLQEKFMNEFLDKLFHYHENLDLKLDFLVNYVEDECGDNIINISFKSEFPLTINVTTKYISADSKNSIWGLDDGALYPYTHKTISTLDTFFKTLSSKNDDRVRKGGKTTQNMTTGDLEYHVKKKLEEEMLENDIRNGNAIWVDGHYRVYNY